jgi:hypothetical protein
MRIIGRELCAPNLNQEQHRSASYGYAAHWLGGEFERLQGWMIVPLMFVAVIALIAGGLFVRQREAQLITEAERAIPGPLELR